MEKQRLSKVLAQAGIASRRHCEEIIFSGRVRVNGVPALLPQTMVGSDDMITLDDKPLPSIEPKVYYLLNKPAGYVCANIDIRYKKVKDLFKGIEYRIFTVGRLDKETTGLLLVTNDGHFANKVIHPSSDIEKEYYARVDKTVTKKNLAQIAKGTLVEGIFCKPKLVKQESPDSLRIIVQEGKKREVRRILENTGFQVLDLHRIRIGGLFLDKKLRPGQWRPMRKEEKKLIFKKRCHS